MTTGHLTQETIAGWGEGNLAPRERIDAVRHLGECSACRELVNASAGLARLEAALDGGDDHPQFHDLEALADGEADPVAHDLISLHLAKCETCAEEYGDLVAFRASFQEKARQPRRLRWALPTVAVLAGVVLVVTFTMRAPKPAAPNTPVSATAALTASLHDAGATIGLDAAGTLHGLENVPQSDREMLRQVLQSQTLPVSPEAAKLQRTREVRLGGASASPAAANAFQALGPAGTVVPEQNPRFYWKSPEGAHGFIVSVYTMYFEPVVKSRELKTSEWTPDQRLAEGRSYVWTVSAVIDGKRVTVPQAPEPEALFRIATADERRQLDAATRATPESALLEAAVASRLGMVGTARQALARLEAANPGSPLVAALAKQILPETTNTK